MSHGWYNPLIILLASTLMCGCGVGSIYGPGYYSETKIGDLVVRVNFRGGDHPVTGDLCLLRCSEVALEAGYSHFQVVDSESGSSIDPISTTYPFHRHYPMEDSFFRDTSFVTKTILLLDSDLENGFSYNAAEVVSSIRAKYDIE